MLVSTIIPVYNGAAYICEALESALAQRNINQEVIVVDDGSTDGTIDILRSFAKQIRVIYQKNQGQAVARNLGASVAKGEYLAFLDADDIWMPDKLAIQLYKCSQFAISHTNSWIFGGVVPKATERYDPREDYGGWVLEKLLLINFITTSSVLVRRDIFEYRGGFRSQYTSIEDWDLWLRLAADFQLGYVPEPLVRYRMQSHSTSTRTHRTLPLHIKLIKEVFGPGGVGSNHPTMRRISLSKSYSINSRFSAIAGDWPFSAYCAMRSIICTPFEWETWKLLGKAFLMPLGVKY